MTEEISNRYKLDLIRSLALGVSTSAAIGSLALMLQTGNHSGSMILILLFSVWVLSPFILLVAFCLLSRRWPSRVRVPLYTLTVTISVLTLLFYGERLSFSGVRPAFVFLVIPFISWIVMLTAYTFLRR